MQQADHRLSCLSVTRKRKTKDCASLPLLAPNARMPSNYLLSGMESLELVRTVNVTSKKIC